MFVSKARLQAMEASIDTLHVNVGRTVRLLDELQAKRHNDLQHIRKLENMLTLLALDTGREFYMTEPIPEKVIPAIPSSQAIRKIKGEKKQ